MEMPEGWDWLKMIPSTNWYQITLNGYPDWELVSYEGDHPTPASIYLTIVQDVDRSSRDLAIETDDWVEGRFYYRDWTKSGIPFVDKNEEYYSRFWFQLEKDAKEFHNRYGGELQYDERSL